MTLQHLVDTLRDSIPETYEDMAKQGVPRCVVVRPVGRMPLVGDNRIQLDAQRVQLDILTPTREDILPADVFYVLWLLEIPYTVEEESYDPEYNRFRTILSLVVI